MLLVTRRLGIAAGVARNIRKNLEGQRHQ